MAGMILFLTEDAKKDLKKIGSSEAIRIVRKLETYAENPMAFRKQVKKLQGQEALRLRIGDYRVLFSESGIVLRVLRVLRIGHRREIYR
jgi:mRNA interferase RelE/StbE